MTKMINCMAEMFTKNIFFFHREHQLGWPNGLAIDLHLDRIWWCDAMFDRIQSSRMDGSDLQTLRAAFITHPFGLAVDARYLYYTDWGQEAILRVEKSNPIR